MNGTNVMWRQAILVHTNSQWQHLGTPAAHSSHKLIHCVVTILSTFIHITTVLV